jgi:hypothetical protein
MTIYRRARATAFTIEACWVPKARVNIFAMRPEKTSWYARDACTYQVLRLLWQRHEGHDDAERYRKQKTRRRLLRRPTEVLLVPVQRTRSSIHAQRSTMTLILRYSSVSGRQFGHLPFGEVLPSNTLGLSRQPQYPRSTVPRKTKITDKSTYPCTSAREESLSSCGQPSTCESKSIK